MAYLVNDIHSQLNAAHVADVLEVDSLAAVQAAIAQARDSGVPVAVAGGRHAMGGQQFCEGGLLVDTGALARVLAFDRDRGTFDVAAR